MDLPLWNVALSFISALILFWIKMSADETKRIQILVNRTREEMAREYVTKAEVHNDINRVLTRLEQLDAKLDRLIMDKRDASGK